MVVVVVGVTFGQRNVKSGYDNKLKQKVVNLGENRKPTATMWLLFYLGGVDLVELIKCTRSTSNNIPPLVKQC